MIEITIPAVELWDEIKQEFIKTKEQTIRLEHSLVSISKWESKWCKPFWSNKDKTNAEIIDYIRCMTLTQNVDPNTYLALTAENLSQILAYIDAPMTARVSSDNKKSKGTISFITAENVYYWMINCGIPMECEKWHFNRLMALIHFCLSKQTKPEKRSRSEILSDHARINAENRKRFNSKG